MKLITTSVVLGNKQGESRGGVCLIDIDRQDVRHVMDWNEVDSDRQGSEQGQGPHGIAIDGETVYIAASDELFAYTHEFKLIGSWRNPFLRRAREMSIYERVLYIVSAEYDSVLAFDMDKKKFFWALRIDLDQLNFKGSVYNPEEDQGPLPLNKLHLNSVYANDHGMYITGIKSGGMLHFNGRALNMSATLPEGTHNAQPYRDGVLFCDTEADAVRYASRSGEEDRALKVPDYDPADLVSNGIDDARAARQGFARGLCVINDRIVAAGSSPATVSLYDFKESKTLLSVALTMDIRNTIHSIAVWPF